MKKILFLSLILIMSASVLFITGCSKKEDSSVITIASDATWPPMEFLNENKEIIGFDVDLIKAAAKAGGFEVKVVNTAWDGIFAGLANGNYDAVISSVTITDDRKAAMDFSVPYINAGQVLIVAKESSGMTTLADMAGKKVGAQIGTTGAIAISDAGNVELKTYDELGLAIEDLANGNIEGVVADSPIAADYVLGNDTYKSVLEIVGEPFTDEFYGVAVKKGNSDILAILNAGLESVIASGERDELINKWLR
ncbi:MULTISPECIES: basic amino acid ABC transporter substrate-binding protein [unclassified Oceanispirochaeta]|uniref:basic amino acid ABC transporter substrate-binding protein n=1 Tax=unclassified Oceanispirochaeta TaxID=2635722 RepID=UPI000E096FE2|nr:MULTISPECIES: basic amino acid ABC transporter substrate-binding protein [unclassified Oceanispirochaeta]MBF9015572.1 basic amino acid ABC transporter substrate-binding protein [Oceanispirochaeta sp. M2]NPD73939.1 basic amino acid ABC transporter substrate-binding protein [Oceanispirochaeta sp. M1]RDG30250.1 basic amino acid ABC transporter substrate-binding protein [Oceanispirochaeta sp. M1]